MNYLMGPTLTCTTLAMLMSVCGLTSAQAWIPGVEDDTALSGFSVNRESRNDVVSFWHTIYQRSEGYEDRVNWTGLAGGPGSTSEEFKQDVLRRINFFRAMAGMNADLTMTSSSSILLTPETPTAAQAPASTSKQTAAQAAAYMLTVNSDEYRPGGGVSTGAANPHNPPLSWNWGSSTARNGAYYSNLAVGFYGPGAIDAYMHEEDQAAAGGTNHEVAHRRLILFSRRAEFATGDVTMTPSGSNPYLAANALYAAGHLLSPPTPQFVAWPAAGYFPEPLASKYWSLSFPGADFSSASVVMRNRAGELVTQQVVSRSANYGDSTLVWEPTAGQIFSAETDDQVYDVTVSGVMVDGVAESHQYQVTLINPNRLLESPPLSGSVSPPDSGASYFFDPVDQASGYRFQVAEQVVGSWMEGAEPVSSAEVIDGTQSTYALSSASAARSGSYGFHLGLTEGDYESQFVELDRQLIAGADSELVFHHRKRRMGGDTRAAAEISVDGGETWTELWGLQGDNGYSTVFAEERLSLSAYQGQVIRIRFSVQRPFTATAGYWAADGNPGGFGDYNGIHIDDIELTGSDLELVNIHETDYPAEARSVTLAAGTAGSAGEVLTAGVDYRIRLRVKMGDSWFYDGPEMVVQAVEASTLSDYDAWARAEYPMLGDFNDDDDQDGIPNGVERVFGLNPTNKADALEALTPELKDGCIRLSHSLIEGGSVSAEQSMTLMADSWQEVTVTVVDNVATVEAPLSAPACYLRWKVVQP